MENFFHFILNNQKKVVVDLKEVDFYIQKTDFFTNKSFGLILLVKNIGFTIFEYIWYIIDKKSFDLAEINENKGNDSFIFSKKKLNLLISFSIERNRHYFLKLYQINKNLTLSLQHSLNPTFNNFFNPYMMTTTFSLNFGFCIFKHDGYSFPFSKSIIILDVNEHQKKPEIVNFQSIRIENYYMCNIINIKSKNENVWYPKNLEKYSFLIRQKFYTEKSKKKNLLINLKNFKLQSYSVGKNFLLVHNDFKEIITFNLNSIKKSSVFSNSNIKKIGKIQSSKIEKKNYYFFS